MLRRMSHDRKQGGKTCHSCNSDIECVRLQVEDIMDRKKGKRVIENYSCDPR